MTDTAITGEEGFEQLTQGQVDEMNRAISRMLGSEPYSKIFYDYEYDWNELMRAVEFIRQQKFHVETCNETARIIDTDSELRISCYSSETLKGNMFEAVYQFSQQWKKILK